MYFPQNWKKFKNIRKAGPRSAESGAVKRRHKREENCRLNSSRRPAVVHKCTFMIYFVKKTNLESIF